MSVGCLHGRLLAPRHARLHAAGSDSHRHTGCGASQRGSGVAARTQEAAASYQWTGTDEFDELDDRKALPPLALPCLKSPKRIVLVRHGQSTWNAEGRIQGSTDFAVLTSKGEDQARKTHDMVRPATLHTRQRG